jgi:hypothetical protein
MRSCIAVIITVIYIIIPSYVYGIYGEGNYSIDVAGIDKRINIINFNLNLQSRKRWLSFNPVVQGNINLRDKSFVITYTQVDIFNPVIEISAGENISPDIIGLVVSAPRIKGVKVTANKGLFNKRIIPSVFKGVGNRNNEVYGIRLDAQFKHDISSNIFWFKDSIAGDSIGGRFDMPFLLWKVSIEEEKKHISDNYYASGTGTQQTIAGTITQQNTELNLSQNKATSTISGTVSTSLGTQTIISTSTTTIDIYPVNIGFAYCRSDEKGYGLRFTGAFRLKRLSSDINYSVINNDKRYGLTAAYQWRLFGVSAGYSVANNVNTWNINTRFGTNTKIGNIMINGKYSITDGLSISDDKTSWSIDGIFSSRRMGAIDITAEYSVLTGGLPQSSKDVLRLKGEFKLGKRLWLGGRLAREIDKVLDTGSITGTNMYTWYTGYKWIFDKGISLALKKQQSFNETIGRDMQMVNYISMNMLFSPRFPLSLTSEIGIEDIKGISRQRPKSQIALRREINLKYSYADFNPWITYTLTNTDDRTETNRDTLRKNISIGVKKRITRRLTLTLQKLIRISQSQYKSMGKIYTLVRKSTEEKINLKYKFPNYPLNMELEFFDRDNTGFNWKVVFSYRRKDRRDYLKYKDKALKFTESKEFRFGIPPEDMTPVSKKLPSKDEFLQLGIVEINVFKDKDADRVFDKDEEGLSGVEAIIYNSREDRRKASKVVTTETGKACFIDIPPGEYILILELGSVPIDLICVAELEQKIKIEQGDFISLNFPLQKGGTVKGRVFRDEDRDGVLDDEETGDHDMIIYADEIPTFTGYEGKYRFTNLPPGKVKIRIDKASIPKGFVMTTPDMFEVEVKPEGVVDGINFGIAEEEVEIEFEEEEFEEEEEEEW